jgi:hypothetical protein
VPKGRVVKLRGLTLRWAPKAVPVSLRRWQGALRDGEGGSSLIAPFEWVDEGQVEFALEDDADGTLLTVVET